MNRDDRDERGDTRPVTDQTNKTGQNPETGGGDPLAALTGGLDMNALLAQAQSMQQHMQDAQRRLAEAEFVGSSGGGAVVVTLTGVGDLVAVTVKPGSFDGSDPESLADLGDLIVAASRDAKNQAEAQAAQALGPMAQMMGGALGPPGTA
ncbi:MAG: YbaB/EbfC family nucleoid-associated protein [Nocardioides sp.]